MRTINLKDIAALVGVSTTAVSNVLNGAPIRIGDGKRQLIVQTARKYNYRPNLLARSLKRRKAGVIGIVVPDMTTLFYPELIRLLETELFAHGYQTLICNSGNNALCEKKHLETLLSRFVDGLIISPAGNGANTSLIRSICGGETPVVCVDRYLPKEKIHYVTTDSRAAAGRAVAWLHGAGAARIFYLGESFRHQAIDERLAGIKDAAKIPPRDVILCRPARKQIYENCVKILRALPAHSGFFLESNRFLPGLLDAAAECGLKIPHDLPVIGFDPPALVLDGAADYAAMRALSGPIPVLRQNVKAMAENTAKWMRAKLSNSPVEFRPLLLKADLIYNQTM